MSAACAAPPSRPTPPRATHRGHRRPRPEISRHLFGQFAEHLGTGIYGGIWVGKDPRSPTRAASAKDVVEALRAIKVPNIRWPGGCYADKYHWRDGIGPQARRPKTLNPDWGGVIEPNSFGTHEFSGTWPSRWAPKPCVHQRRLRLRARDGRVAGVHDLSQAQQPRAGARAQWRGQAFQRCRCSASATRSGAVAAP